MAATAAAVATAPIATFMIDLVDYISGPVFIRLIFGACLCTYAGMQHSFDLLLHSRIQQFEMCMFRSCRVNVRLYVVQIMHRFMQSFPYFLAFTTSSFIARIICSVLG